MARGRTLLGEYRYERVMLIFSVDPSALQSRLAVGWEPSDSPGGNLAVGFCNVASASFASGTPVPDSSQVYVVLNGTITNRNTGEEVNMRYGTFASNPGALPVAGGVPKDPTVETTEAEYSCRKSCRDGSVRVDVACLAVVGSSGKLQTEISYRPSAAETREWETRVVGKDPRTELILENREAQDLLLHRSEGVDRTSAVEWRMSVRDFKDVFDGNEKLEAVAAVPWSVRRVFAAQGSTG